MKIKKKKVDNTAQRMKDFEEFGLSYKDHLGNTFLIKQGDQLIQNYACQKSLSDLQLAFSMSQK